MKILFRNYNNSISKEKEICKKYFDVIDNIVYVKKNDLVIGRYSVLPYYEEVETSVSFLGGKLINNYQQHLFVADFLYYDIIKDYTFETWNDNNFYLAPEGRYVVKGCTNSNKLYWNKSMYASSKRKAFEIASNLISDSIIGQQKIIYRQYVPLKTFDTGLYDLPFTNEWRFFCLKDKIIDYGYYWENMYDRTLEQRNFDHKKMIDFVSEVMLLVKDYIDFYVIDVAEKENGEWVVVELNDGQMSGLCGVDSESFYKNLLERVSHDY